MNPPIYLFTDGASKGNPGPGGYGLILSYKDYRVEKSGGYICTTNNRMELMAVIVGLEQIKWSKARVEVISDSSYVVNAINQKWLEGWIKKDFKKVKNVDLWKRLVPLLEKFDVCFNWVKGHNGHPENERCDFLATAAAEAALKNGGPEDENFLANI